MCSEIACASPGDELKPTVDEEVAALKTFANRGFQAAPWIGGPKAKSLARLVLRLIADRERMQGDINMLKYIAGCAFPPPEQEGAEDE